MTQTSSIGSRFTPLIHYLKDQEDQIRAELTRVDQAIRDVEGEIRQVHHELETAVQFGGLQQRQQLLTFTTHCVDKEAVFTHQLEGHQEQRAEIQDRLLVLWRRRRSLETLDQREQERLAARSERQQNDDILDGAVRAWYLQDVQQEALDVQLLDSEVLP